MIILVMTLIIIILLNAVVILTLRMKKMQMLPEKEDDEEAAACANLAKLYLDGKGVSPSMDRGIDLLIQAANLGCVEAQTHLGIYC